MSYRLVVTREGEDWLADIPELDGAHTFSRTLGGLERSVREVVVLAADLPDEAVDTVELEWDIHTDDPELDTAAAAARHARAEKSAAESRAVAATEQAMHRIAATRLAGLLSDPEQAGQDPCPRIRTYISSYGTIRPCRVPDRRAVPAPALCGQASGGTGAPDRRCASSKDQALRAIV